MGMDLNQDSHGFTATQLGSERDSMQCVSLPLSCTVEQLYACLYEQGAATAILDSGWEPRPDARYPLSQRCIIASEPFAILKAWGNHAVLEWMDGRRDTGAPFELLRTVIEAFSLPPDDAPTPFPAGAIGYFGYELKSILEPVESNLPADMQMPDLWLALFDAAITIDLSSQTVHITSTGLPEQGCARKQRAAQRAEQLLNKISAATQHPTFIPLTDITSESPKVRISSNFSHAAYLKAVQRVKDYIAAGDIYQANLSQRFKMTFRGDPFILFLHLRQRSPAPFAAFINGMNFHIVSTSPERFLHFNPHMRIVHTRPIKGTRPRGATPEADAALADELINSIKDNAEHVMIVDLERNDLGRVAEIGSVWVPELAVLEPFPTVFHLTSTVEATLRRDCDIVDLLKATFPGGSITGAPKIRAMQIIEEIETVRRGVYTGALGYISFTSMMDLSIVIRTIVLQDGIACFHAGGGIVADSDPEAEYEETLVKARALAETLALIEAVSIDGRTSMGVAER